jgi:hypothetical protein
VGAITWGLSCAIELPEGKTKSAIVDTLVREGTKAVTLEGVLPDDTSGLYEQLYYERESAKDEAGAAKVAGEWFTFLEGQAKKAATPGARAAFDPHRVSAALGSKQAEKMVEPLQLSEKEFPKDYNPSARLAIIYRELGKLDEGLAAIDRALARCKDKKGDAAGKKKTIEEAVKYAKKLPKTQVSEKRIAALEAQLTK